MRTVVAIKDIIPNPFQARKHINRETVKQLAEEIRNFGLWPGALKGRWRGGRLELCYGHRRLEAIKYLSWDEVEVEIVDMDDDEMALQSLAENLQREGLSDVGTHLVDLVTWVLFPGEPINHRQEIAILAGKRWPTLLTRSGFEAVTEEAKFPPHIADAVRDDRLEYFCNNRVGYKVRGIHVRLDAVWDFEAAPGAGDTHLAVFQGSRSRIEVRQGKEVNFKAELYVVPRKPADRAALAAALGRKVQELQARFPGVAVEAMNDRFCVRIPDRYRTGHEAHFGEVARLFLSYLADPKALPAWEKPNMLAKYFVSTEGTRRGA